LYLVKKGRSGYSVYRGTVLAVERRLPKGEEGLVPEYYRDRGILKYVGVWFKLAKLQPLDVAELSNLYIANSGMAVPNTLRASMAALFIVKEGKGIGAH
jgi:hypothetical protein